MNNREITCPYCQASKPTTWAVPGQSVIQEKAQPGDVTICAKCAGICKVEPDMQRRKITEEELARMSDRTRQVLIRGVNMVRARIAKRN